MHFMAPDPAAIVADPTWLAHRYDPVGDHVHFVRVPRAAHAAGPFLTDEYLPAGGVAVVPRAAAVAAVPTPAAPAFIFHSAYCCSTLLVRALDLPGVAMGLSEPVILNDLSGWRDRGGGDAVAGRLRDALTLLARPFGAGERVVVKPSNVVNGLAPAMLDLAPGARALLLHAPLPGFLGSIARKGMWGRLWVRELFVKLTRAGLADYGFTIDELMQQTDLQIAALGWLAQHRLFAATVARFGEARVRTLDSERLLADPAAAMAALNTLFELGMASPGTAAAATGPAFTRNSKTGAAFASDERQANQARDRAAFGDEVDKVVAWAEQVAASAGQPMILPAPLF